MHHKNFRRKQFIGRSLESSYHIRAVFQLAGQNHHMLHKIPAHTFVLSQLVYAIDIKNFILGQTGSDFLISLAGSLALRS
jgi:hypothetical protein